MFVVYVHYGNFGGVAFEGGLKRRTVSVADLTTFSLDLGTFGATAASYFQCWAQWDHF